MSAVESETTLPPVFKWGLPLVIIAITYLLVQWMIASKASAAKKPSTRTIPIVETSQVQLQTVQFIIESQGTVRPKQRIDVTSEVAGAVEWVSPKLVNGGQVVKGELLLKIDPIDYQVMLAEAKSALAQAQLNYEDEQAEYKRGTAYGLTNKVNTQSLRKHKLATVEAEFEAAKERLRQAEHELNKTEIKAAFDGLISAKAVDIGQYVAVGKVVFNLMGTSVAEIQLPINASELRYLGDINTPTSVLLRSRVGYGEKQNQLQWQAQLVRIEAFVDEQTRVVNTIAELNNPYGLTPNSLTMGMFVEAEIVGAQLNSAVRLPISVLHGNKVYVVENGELKLRQVEIYRQEKQQVVISQGLKQGDRVVMTKLDLMVEGMQVQPRLINASKVEDALNKSAAL